MGVPVGLCLSFADGVVGPVEVSGEAIDLAIGESNSMW
jgi:hypothetical protein